MMSQMPAIQQKVHIIDDDEAFRGSLQNLLQSADISVETFSSPQSFIDRWPGSGSGCILLDIRFPGADGLDFIASFREAAIPLPVILMTGHADVPTSVRGLKAGAVDYLMKPFDEEALLDVVRQAVEQDAERFSRDADFSVIAARYDSLTIREKEVLSLVCIGLMNKQIANRLDLSEITAKVHRGTMMRKMGVRSVADLVRANEALKRAGTELVSVAAK